MKQVIAVLLAVLMLLAVETKAAANDDELINQVRRVVEEVRTAAYPELKGAKIKIELFDSKSDYFQTRFTVTSFLFKRRLSCLLMVNRNLFTHNVPDDGLRAIIAHELGHAFYFSSRNRIKLLGLLRLTSKGYTVRFERRTDMQAIIRGYGSGLKSYRLWLYGRIPANKIAEKKRNYFSPEEIELLEQVQTTNPRQIMKWAKQPPHSLVEIERAIKNRP